MADGFDRRHALDVGRSLLEECRACRQAPLVAHQCAFLTGVFDPVNWNCRTLQRLAEHSTRVENDELHCATHAGDAGHLVLLVTRIGAPQRVRLALVVSPDLQVRPLTADFAEHLLART